MKKAILTAILALCFAGVSWGGTPAHFWPLANDLVSVTSSDTYIGTETHAETNRTRVNPDTGWIEDVGANVARFELVGGFRALLIEPAGTNLITYSHEFRDDISDWAETNSLITDNATTGPDGTTNADKLVEANDEGGIHSVSAGMIAATNFTDDAAVTFSVYLKPAERTWVRLRIKNKAAFSSDAFFNLVTGVVGIENVDNYGSEEVAKGFWRFWITNNIGHGGFPPYFRITIARVNGSVTYDGDGTSGIYIWGAQAEESPVPTSLIHTSGGTETRATESGEPHFTLPTGLFDDKGTCIVWARMAYDKDVSDSYHGSGIMSCSDSHNSVILNSLTSGLTLSRDGESIAQYAAERVEGNIWYKFAAQWGYEVSGQEKFRVGFDSGIGISWGPEIDFDGSYDLGTDIRLGYGLFSRMHLRNLMLFDEILTDAEINDAPAWSDGTIAGVTQAGVSVNAESLFIFDAKTTGSDETFTLPIYDGGSYDFLVDWGDAQTDTITAYDDAARIHTYAVAGTYQVIISGEIVGWRFAGGGSKDKIYDIKAWGPLRLGNLDAHFYGCSNLTVSATDVLDLTGTTSLASTFRSCTSLTTLDVKLWDTSLITSLTYTFFGCTSLETLDVKLWDTSSVTNLDQTFFNCLSLTTLDVSLWDTFLITTLYRTFFNCASLTTLDVSSWDIHLVTTLNKTFEDCSSLTIAPVVVNWDISLVADATDFMQNTIAMTTAAYDAVLIAWEGQPHQDDVTIHFGTATYTGGGVVATARAALVTDGWIITDGGIAP